MKKSQYIPYTKILEAQSTSIYIIKKKIKIAFFIFKKVFDNYLQTSFYML